LLNIELKIDSLENDRFVDGKAGRIPGYLFQTYSFSRFTHLKPNKSYQYFTSSPLLKVMLTFI
jgi:hypothetical protein